MIKQYQNLPAFALLAAAVSVVGCLALGASRPADAGNGVVVNVPMNNVAAVKVPNTTFLASSKISSELFWLFNTTCGCEVRVICAGVKALVLPMRVARARVESLMMILLFDDILLGYINVMWRRVAV